MNYVNKLLLYFFHKKQFLKIAPACLLTEACYFKIEGFTEEAVP
jgi:hypothetical protein